MRRARPEGRRAGGSLGHGSGRPREDLKVVSSSLAGRANKISMLTSTSDSKKRALYKFLYQLTRRDTGGA